MDDDEGGVSLAVSSETFALWQALDTADSLPVERMDAIVEEMMRQPPEEVAWDQLLERLEMLQHPDLPGVVRRIIETVPLTADPGIGRFFSSAGEVLA